MESGFLSGFARDMIFRNEEEPSARVSFFNKFDQLNPVSFLGSGGVGSFTSEGLLDVEFNLMASPLMLHGRHDALAS